MQTNAAAVAADNSSPSDTDHPATFALEARLQPGADALLRVLNPLQKLDIAPLTVRAGHAWGGELMIVEVQFSATATQARQFHTQVSAQVTVDSAELMRCAR